MKYIHGAIGYIIEILSKEKCLIEFEHDNAIHKAILPLDRFFHNGKKIPLDVEYTNYVKIGLPVTFSCHILDNFENQNTVSPWYVTCCWRNDTQSKNLQMKIGMMHKVGRIVSLNKRHGVLMSTDDDIRVYFIASKLYLYEKRISAAKSLHTELSIDDKVYFDAVPCFPGENREGCGWFAALVFKGKRPDTGDAPLEKPFALDYTKNGKSEIVIMPDMHIMNQYTSDARKLFVYGSGSFMQAYGDEYGLILGEFKKNLFQLVLFHRKNAFLFKTCLAHAKLSEVFKQDDRLKFIVVDAPHNFIADWIAVQVAVDSPEMDQHHYVNDENERKLMQKK